MSASRPKNILIAPLDWGLGHTTRCIPLISYLYRLGHNPIFAGNAAQRSFITDVIGSHIHQVHLDGYNVTYSKWNRVAQVGLMAQLPAISAAISREQRWLTANAAALKLDGIISDNRYGLFHAEIPSIIITHQPQVLSGLGAVADNVVRHLHYKYLGRYDAVWIPDNEGSSNFGGALSHPVKLPLRAQYIGPLSRFADYSAASSGDTVVIMLSGPEPQRTELSGLLWRQALNQNRSITFIEGSIAAQQPDFIPRHITYHKRLPDNLLAPVLSAAGIVISRSGYSTIMDLAALGKKAILIPTIGQTEQEYLAASLHEQGIFYRAAQNGFDMVTAIAEAEKFPYRSLDIQGSYKQFEKAVKTWLESI